MIKPDLSSRNIVLILVFTMLGTAFISGFILHTLKGYFIMVALSYILIIVAIIEEKAAKRQVGT